MDFRLRHVAAALFAATSLAAQDTPTGRIVGRVVDSETGRGVTDAGVQVVGTTIGTSTGIDGRFTLAAVPAGTITIQVRRLGYQPKTVTGLQLAASTVLDQTISLTPSVAMVEAQIVTATAERGSVESALDQQRNAAQVVNAVTSEQIGRSPDANAAQAIQRVSGVSVQDGKYVLVRGLGERYTTTSLNGSRVPSPEPERKVVPLDLFPSGLIQSVTTSKTFTPDLPGDFSGAHVDIKTREFPAQRQLTYGVTVGAGEGTWGKRIAHAPGVGGEPFALAGSARDLPAVARGSLGNVSPQVGNQIINSFRDVWQAGLRDARPNTSARLSIGGSDDVLGRRFGYLLSGTYSYSQEARSNQSHALVGPAGAEKDRFTGDQSGESVLWGGLFNASTLIGQHSRLSLNGMYNRSADNDARVETGVLEEFGLLMEQQLLSYVERAVWSSQLVGEHQTGRHVVDWSVTGSGVTRREPDRSELGHVVETATDGTQRKLWDVSGNGAMRTFSDLDEKSFEGKTSYRLELGRSGRASVKIGGLARGTERESNVQAFAIRSSQLSDSVRALPPEEIFGGRFTAPDSAVLQLTSLSQGGSYTAADAIFAGFAMLELPLTETIRLIGGARMEHAALSVRSTATLGSPRRVKPEYTDVLPALALTYRPTEAHTVRFSVSRTLARPEYRELSDVATFQPVSRTIQVGNRNLVRTLISNADARYEFYPRRGEVLSLGVFAKRFEKPIERVYDVTSGSRAVTTWVNASGADNYGVELEARKDLDQLAEWLAPFTMFSSVTLMQSEIDLGTTSSTNANRAMVGQSPYLVNAGLTYSSRDRKASATLLYNRVGPRIWEAGLTPVPDAVESARDALDLSVRLPMRGGLTARFDAKNLLDAPYEIRQGSVTREYYQIGRTLQFGLSVQR
jgi:outer membrane receptor protein involved in Fe transport